MKMQEHNIQARPNNDQDKVADSGDLDDVLIAETGQTCPPGSAEVQFWDAQIIAERRYMDEKTGKQETDYLVEALPIWRRHGSRRGVDETHLEIWEALSSDKTRVVEAEIGQYEISIYGRHPIFEQCTAAKEIFMRGLQLSEPDPADEMRAMQMLGHMILRCLQAEAEDANMLTELAVTVCYGLGENEIKDTDRVLTYGRNFIEQVNGEEQRQLAADLLADGRALDFNTWTIALCIALLPEKDFLQQWREDAVPSLRAHAGRTRQSEYRAAITTFLDDYHNKIQGSLSFMHTLRTFDKLSQMLKGEVDDAADAAEVPCVSQNDSDEPEQEDEGEDVDMGFRPKRAGTNEVFDSEEDAGSGVTHGDGEDDSESDTEEAHFREVREAAMRDAVRSENVRRTTRAEKRMSDEEADSSSSSGSCKTRRRL